MVRNQWVVPDQYCSSQKEHLECTCGNKEDKPYTLLTQTPSSNGNQCVDRSPYPLYFIDRTD